MGYNLRRLGDFTMPATFGTHCNGCPYRGQTCHLPLSMEVNATRALLIFQAPGEQEWRRRRPVISENPYSAAARLRNSLRRIGACRCDFSITNAVQCYPGKCSNGQDESPRAQAKRSCAQWLRADIEAYRWRRVVVFGAIAKKSVIDLGYEENNPRFRFERHPSSRRRNRRLLNCDLDAALRWALG